MDESIDDQAMEHLGGALRSRLLVDPQAGVAADAAAIWTHGRRRRTSRQLTAIGGVVIAGGLAAFLVTTNLGGGSASDRDHGAPVAAASASAGSDAQLAELESALTPLLPADAVLGSSHTDPLFLTYQLGTGASAGSLRFVEDGPQASAPTGQPFGANAGPVLHSGSWSTGTTYAIYASGPDSQTVSAVLNPTGRPRLAVSLNRGFDAATAAPPSGAYSEASFAQLLQQLDATLSRTS